MIEHGLISNVDAETLEKTLDLIISSFPDEVISICEVGIFNGGTIRGIKKYLDFTGKQASYKAIDNKKDFDVQSPFPECEFIIGNSNEVYYKLADNSQHLIFIDANHCFASVVADFFCYANKVIKGGYIAFHDTAKHIKPFTGYQSGDKENPDSYIAVRRALHEIGILYDEYYGWELIFDEADENDEMGGICVFKKVEHV